MILYSFSAIKSQRKDYRLDILASSGYPSLSDGVGDVRLQAVVRGPATREAGMGPDLSRAKALFGLKGDSPRSSAMATQRGAVLAASPRRFTVLWPFSGAGASGPRS